VRIHCCGNVLTEPLSSTGLVVLAKARIKPKKSSRTWSWVPRGLKPRMTVLAKTSTKLPDQVSQTQKVVAERGTPPPSCRKGGLILKHINILERTKIWPWNPAGPEAKNDCAGEASRKLLLCSSQITQS
jgi:hypothetical protein